jgi:hypothetical protein
MESMLCLICFWERIEEDGDDGPASMALPKPAEDLTGTADPPVDRAADREAAVEGLIGTGAETGGAGEDTADWAANNLRT